MSSTRQGILEALRDAPEPSTIAEVAHRLGIHPNTVRFHMDSLIESGQVEQVQQDPDGPGRPAIRLRAVAAMDRGGPRAYQSLAETLLLDLESRRRPTEGAHRAGRQWGRRLASQVYGAKTDSVTGLVTALDEIGFAPKRLSRKEIRLRHCPFLELTTPTGGLVCAIHRGLMEGVLEGTDTAVERLDPFVRPDCCVARLAPAARQAAATQN